MGDKSRFTAKPASGWTPFFERAERELLGAPLGAGTRAMIEIYLDEVLRWGSRVDLIAPRDENEFVDLSLGDAFVVARVESERGRATDSIVDVGTGGGAPGIPLLAVLSESRGRDLPGVLVEPRTKRTAFLRSVTSSMGLSNTIVERSRSDVLEGGRYDVALARATLPPPLWLREGARLARAAVWVLLAKEEAPELEGYVVTDDVTYEWPWTRARRRAVRYVPKGA